MPASVARYSHHALIKHGQSSKNKAVFVFLTLALRDNTFLVGQRGIIQTGSPRLFFHSLANTIPHRGQAVYVLGGGGGGGLLYTNTIY